MDFCHLRENLQKSRRIVFQEGSPEGKTWLDNVMHPFRHVGYDAAWDQLVAWRSTLHAPARRQEGNRLLHYVTERQPMIRYPEFRSRGWRIGSGRTESECKTTTHRVKGRGRRWDSHNAEGMMALACLADSRMWQTYWASLSPARNQRRQKILPHTRFTRGLPPVPAEITMGRTMVHHSLPLV